MPRGLARYSRGQARGLLAAGALLGLCACASLPRGPFGPLPVDLTSPVAADIRKLDVSKAAYPSFRDIPSQPTDVRPVSAWSRNILDTLRARRATQAVVVAQPQTLYGADAFAQESRALAAPPLSADEAKTLDERTSDFAKSQRARATPPSPAR